MAGLPQLTLYSRQYCHLCHEMQAQLDLVRAGLPEELGFELNVLDVDRNPELTARFNELVPVLMHDEHELARYRLDETAVLNLREYLRANLAQTR